MLHLHHFSGWSLLALIRAVPMAVRFAEKRDTPARTCYDNDIAGPLDGISDSRPAGSDPVDNGTMAFTPRRPVRVLYIIDSLWNVGGAEACLLRMTKHMPQPDFECEVLTFHSAPESSWFIDKFDCPVHHWQLNNIYDWNALRVAWRLWRFIRERKIDVVHTFFQTSDLWAGSISKLAGAKVHISSRRDLGILRKPKHEIAYRLLRGVFDQVQTVSDGVRQYAIRKDGIDPRRTQTVHTGIETAAEVPESQVKAIRGAFGLTPGTPVITTVANSRYVKGLDILVRATARIVKEFPTVRVMVVGGMSAASEEKDFNDELQKLPASLGVSESLTFLGHSDEVQALLQLSDVFVLPSRSEGMSNALLEAMRAHLPCVVTAVGGNPEAVVDGQTGFVVPSEDPDALADGILKLLRNPDLSRKMGDASLKRWQEQFTVEKMISQLVGAYYDQLELKGERVLVPIQSGK